MKKVILGLLLSPLVFSLDLMAQNWVQGGNTTVGSRRFGTNNNNSVYFETNNTIRGILTNTGNWGFGTTSPGIYKARVRHVGAGFNIERSSNNNDWELFISSANLALYYNGTGNFRGQFNSVTGAYTSVSDKRLKTNIKPMATMLDKINQLKPSTYQFKNTTDNQEHNGFLAQDVLKVFPGMVDHAVDQERNLDVYTMDYSGFGVIAVKGIQELQPIIEEQKKINEEQKLTILALEDRLATLEAAMADVIASKGLPSVPGLNPKTGVKQNLSLLKNNASLEQNKPNPFNQSTTIRYSLPHGSKGQIRIFNQTGTLVKTLIANESGQSILNAYDLTAGTYTYSLMVNGKSAGSKKLIILK